MDDRWEGTEYLPGADLLWLIKAQVEWERIHRKYHGEECTCEEVVIPEEESDES